MITPFDASQPSCSGHEILEASNGQEAVELALVGAAGSDSHGPDDACYGRCYSSQNHQEFTADSRYSDCGAHRPSQIGPALLRPVPDQAVPSQHDPCYGQWLLHQGRCLDLPTPKFILLAPGKEVAPKKFLSKFFNQTVSKLWARSAIGQSRDNEKVE